MENGKSHKCHCPFCQNWDGKPPIDIFAQISEEFGGGIYSVRPQEKLPTNGHENGDGHFSLDGTILFQSLDEPRPQEVESVQKQ